MSYRYPVNSSSMARERKRFAICCKEISMNSTDITYFETTVYDFDFCDEDADLLCKAIHKNTNLQKLRLDITHLTVNSSPYRALSDYVKRSKRLTLLGLVDHSSPESKRAKTGITSALLEAAAHSSSLEIVSLFGVRFRASSLASLVSSSESLENLHLYYSDFVEDNGAVYPLALAVLTDAFAQNKALQILATAGMRSGLEISLMSVLSRHPSLHTFGPSLGSSACSQALFGLLQYPPPRLNHLKLLFVNFNDENMTDALRSSIGNCAALRQVSLSDCSFKTNSLSETPPNKMDPLAQEFLTAVLNNEHIHSVEFESCTGVNADSITDYVSLRNRVLKDGQIRVPLGVLPRMLRACQSHGNNPATGASVVFRTIVNIVYREDIQRRWRLHAT